MDQDDLPRLLKEQKTNLDALAGERWGAAVTAFVQAISEHTGELQVVASSTTVDECLDANRAIQGFSQVYSLASPKNGRNIRVWITQQPGRINPDDPRLWRLLEACDGAEASLLIVARSIDPTTFVLLKALDIRGLQYYNMWTRRRRLSRLKRASDELGWFNVKAAESAASHPIIQRLPATLTYLRTRETALRRVDIQVARDSGLMEGVLPVTAQLAQWTNRTRIDLPKRWIETITRMASWNTDSPLLVAESVSDSQAIPIETLDLTAGNNDVPVRPRPSISRVPIRGW